MISDTVMISAESKESADAIYKNNNTVLADMVAAVNKKNSTVEYIAKHWAMVRFKFDTADFQLNYPQAFIHTNAITLKRLFFYMMGDYHYREFDNQEAVRITAEWLEAFRLMKKEVWRYRSKAYTDGYRDPIQYQPSLQKDIRAANKKLISALKKAKTDYERAEKMEQHFNELKEKYL